jgi:coenzyme F420-reducing hydrogenase delta subunit
MSGISRDSGRPRTVIFGCARSAGEALRELEAQGSALPAHVEWVSLPCSGSVDVLHLLRALASGAERVLVLGCYQGACQSLEGDRLAEKRVVAARGWLREIGLAEERIAFRASAPNMAADLAAWLEEA